MDRDGSRGRGKKRLFTSMSDYSNPGNVTPSEEHVNGHPQNEIQSEHDPLSKKNISCPGYTVSEDHTNTDAVRKKRLCALERGSPTMLRTAGNRAERRVDRRGGLVMPGVGQRMEYPPRNRKAPPGTRTRSPPVRVARDNSLSPRRIRSPSIELNDIEEEILDFDEPAGPMFWGGVAAGCATCFEARIPCPPMDRLWLDRCTRCASQNLECFPLATESLVGELEKKVVSWEDVLAPWESPVLMDEAEDIGLAEPNPPVRTRSKSREVHVAIPPIPSARATLGGLGPKTATKTWEPSVGVLKTSKESLSAFLNHHQPLGDKKSTRLEALRSSRTLLQS